MGDLSRFLKKNKAVKENIKIAATSSLCDEKGTPLLWEIKPLTTKEDASIREACTLELPVKGRAGMYRPKMDGNKYLAKMAARCVVFPNLDDKDLQNSYGVMGAEQLITEMIDNPGEYNDFMNKIQEFHGFKETFQEKVDEAKN